MARYYDCPRIHDDVTEGCPLCEDTGKVDYKTLVEYIKLRRETRKLDAEFLDRLAREK